MNKEFQRPQEHEEFDKALNNFITTVARELGIYKLLDLLTKWLEKRNETKRTKFRKGNTSIGSKDGE